MRNFWKNVIFTGSNALWLMVAFNSPIGFSSFIPVVMVIILVNFWLALALEFEWRTLKNESEM